MKYAEPILKLIDSFTRLPGVGQKTASRLALFILNSKGGFVEEFAANLLEVKKKVRLCKECMSFAESDICKICDDDSRDKSLVCVVSDFRDMAAIEESGTFKGVYHILHGSLAPLKGIGPHDIKLDELISRIQHSEIDEIIIATGFDSEGESTAAYIGQLLNESVVTVSRIASGVPIGSFIEYMDKETLSRALKGRREL